MQGETSRLRHGPKRDSDVALATHYLETLRPEEE
jgi:hypothetical protein